MPLTRDFRETIQARVERDPAFREELLKEGGRMPPFGRGGSRQGGAARFHQRHNRLSSIVAIAPSSGAIDLTGKPPKSLMRMFGPARPSPPRGSSTPSSVGADPKPAISSRSSLVSRSARGFGSKCARFVRGFNSSFCFASARHSGACWWQPQG